MPDGSINRINIDFGYPGRRIIEDCLRVLEPGGAIELGTLTSYKQEVEGDLKALETSMGVKFRQVPLTALDLKSDFLLKFNYSNGHSSGDPSIKYIVEKPGGGPDVDERTFWERIPPAERSRI